MKCDIIHQTYYSCAKIHTLHILTPRHPVHLYVSVLGDEFEAVLEAGQHAHGAGQGVAQHHVAPHCHGVALEVQGDGLGQLPSHYTMIVTSYVNILKLRHFELGRQVTISRACTLIRHEVCYALKKDTITEGDNLLILHCVRDIMPLYVNDTCINAMTSDPKARVPRWYRPAV
jgi:hypothetical protein